MSMFDNIVFDEFTLLEGEQAEAYKKRKAAEIKAAKKEDKEAINRQYRHVKADMKEKGIKQVFKDHIDKAGRVGADTVNKNSSKLNNELTKKGAMFDRKAQADMARAIDGVRRHERRHPKHECTFSTNYLYESSEIDII